MSSKSNHLSFEDKNKLLQFLLQKCVDGVLEFGKIKEAAQLFGNHWKTVQNLWITPKRLIDEGKPILLSPFLQIKISLSRYDIV